MRGSWPGCVPRSGRPACSTSEALSGQLAGDEFYKRLSAPGPGTGLTPAGWLRALAEAAIKAMRADFAADGKEWPKLWAFCCGLAGEESLEDLEAAADVIAERGLTPVPGVPVPWYQPTAGADVLAARDAYGARFLLIAPFSDPGQPADPDHWYAWDLDWCADGLVVAAGAYGSAAGALAEWRAFAGPPAATAELASCPPELGIGLLDPALAGSLQGESVLGGEPAEFLREIPRLSRRAGALTASLSRLLAREPSSPPAGSRDSAIEDFLDWHTEHAGQPADVRAEAEGALELLLAEWGPDVPPDERAFYACSPHRIQACASILRDSYEPDWVNKGAVSAARLDAMVCLENRPQRRGCRPRARRRPRRGSHPGQRDAHHHGRRGPLPPPRVASTALTTG
jgi:hypothetical protein